MDRAIGVLLLLICGIAIGAGASQMWQWYGYTQALQRSLDLLGERDRLVSELAQVKTNLARAQSDARAARQELYAHDDAAATWSAAPVPAALAERMRDAARAADAASGTANVREADTAAR